MEIDMMKEPDVMVYLMTGFLDSGKTQFLNFTLSQDYFQIDGKTLLILCEEGEEEFAEITFCGGHVVAVNITGDSCAAIYKDVGRAVYGY